MKNRSRKLLAGLVVASAALLGSGDAKAQTTGIDLGSFVNLGDWRDWLPEDSVAQTVEVCVLDADGSGRYTREISTTNARRYTNLGAYSYITEQEDCSTAIDDNCNGLVNEGCDSTEAVCGNGVVESGEECDDGNRITRDSCTNTCVKRDYCGDGIVTGDEECDDQNLDNTDGCTRACQIRSVCGNGIVEGDEQCDDGNLINTDTCSTACRYREFCGDGVVNGTEECDDGNRQDGDGCSQFCTSTGTCGDGLVEGQEECDDGNDVDDDECSNTCTLPLDRCGNGIVDPGEECDDGNTSNDDDCSIDCKSTAAECGNGLVEYGETCDDGNTASGDGCSELCIIEDVCGDGKTTGQEQCDDGNTVMGDGCDETCQIEVPKCGDGKVNQDIEDCDDGNTEDGDGCSANCTIEPVCGNGVTEGDEQCDDGNDIDDDSCSNNCVTVRHCGNGVLETDKGEACDDGNQENFDGCDSACQVELCGNGVLDEGEICDDGNFIDDDNCKNDCTPRERCGDGSVNTTDEQCDDGNLVSGDGCDETCQVEPSCGDGVLSEGEVCDDGNTINGDGCDENCQVEPVCGDGVVNRNEEQCDDGNDSNEDLCLNDCTLAPVCGDGKINAPGEQCDDGDQNAPGNFCSSNCRITVGCGNGIVESNNKEQCDDGDQNGQPGSNCTTACKFVPPTADFAYEAKGGDDCKACMEDKCLGQIGKCAQTDECVAATACHAENSCLDSGLGPLACLCGDDISVNECIKGGEDGDLGSFKGACAAEIVAGLRAGAEKPEDFAFGDAFSSFQNPKTAMGQANQVYICMGRFCEDACSELIDNEAVCGNGVTEGNEACDDGNDVANDGCENDCTETVAVCGNGEIEPGETCDDGNVVDGDGCESDCSITPPMSPWKAGAECDACIEEKCAPQADTCLGDPACLAIVACEAESQCLDAFLGPLTCLCGPGSTVSECQKVQEGAFTGPCAQQIQESLGTVGETGPTFSRFSNPQYAAGTAHQAFICLGRFCKNECTDIIYND